MRIRANVLFVVFCVLAFVACTPAQRYQTKKIYWPKYPDTPRYIYEISLRTEGNIRKVTEEDLFNKFLAGITAKNAINVLVKPYDVAARGGKVVVTDSVSRMALMFDVRRQKLFPFGHRQEGKLSKPMGVGMDGKQFIYVADVSDGVVKVFDGLGKFIRFIGKKGDFGRLVDVAANDKGDRVYAVDAGGIDSLDHKVVIFDGEGNKISSIGPRGGRPGQFNLPIQAAVAKDGTLYVLDAGNFRIQAFDPEGNYLRSWGKVGRSFGDLARPRGIAVDQAGNVYVTDGTFRNFQIFNSSGQLLMAIGNAGLDDQPGNFVLPAGIAVDETDRVYIVDQMMRKVEVIRKLTEVEMNNLVANY